MKIHFHVYIVSAHTSFQHPKTYPNLIQVIETFESVTPLVPEPRILLVGPVGSGKSSFINSVDSAFRGNFSQLAFTDDSRKQTVTKMVSY